jgi:pimeloyl-ACP methyl ester carboxylesterase
MAHVTLADGRILDVQVSGPADGFPFILQHGTPGSLVRYRAIDEAAHRKGLRLMTYSRPGYGSSTRQRGRRVADVAMDIAALLDDLGAERCVTLGWSGGGPHALAAAALLPGRVAAAACVSGIGPFGREDFDCLAGMSEENVKELDAAVAGEDVLARALRAEAEELKTASTADVLSAMSSLLPPVDNEALAGEAGEDLAAETAEALRTGIDGWVDDDLAFVHPWGFELSSIKVPVSVWQGEADLMVPFAHGRWLAEQIPGAQAHLPADEGHISVFLNHLDEVLDELTAKL